MAASWWHFATRVNGRAGPSTSYNVITVAAPGDNILVVEEVAGDGRIWLQTELAVYYAKEFCLPGKRPRSPVWPRADGSDYPPGYKYGVKNSRYIAGFHTGQDYPAPAGTPFVAVVSGRIVRYIGGAYGKGLILRGDDGHEWLYAHAKKRRYPAGKRVKAGQVIGWVDSTGNSDGNHLHLEKSRGSRWSYGKVTRPTW